MKQAILILSLLLNLTPSSTFADDSAPAKTKTVKAAASTQAAKQESTAQKFSADGNGSVEFLAVGKPAMIKILGKGSGPKGDLQMENSALQGKLAFDLNSLDTGIELRNKHTKEKYLEVDKYPQSELTLDPIKLADVDTKSDFSKEGVPFTGKLKLHGTESPVSGTAKVTRKGQELTIKAEYSLKTSDFKIDAPKYMGITVAEDVKVTTDFTAKKQ